MIEDITQRRRNIKGQIEQLIKGYETEPAKGLVHGFQKDVIQNAWGHRKDANRGVDWKLEIRYIENNKGSFLVVEDFNCSGLIGHNYSQNEISDMMANGREFCEKEKLARFSTLYNSGGNTTSAGTYGRGKLMYQAVSSELEYYFDSLTINNNYIANYIDKNENTLQRAKEGEEAKNWIFLKTGLNEKTIPGTRIIIVKPLPIIVENIKNGKILEYIGETWWRILYKYNANIQIYYNNEFVGKAKVPDFYLKYLNDNNYFYKKEYTNGIVSVEADHKYKRLEIFLTREDDPIPEGLESISYYRKGMKIGNVYSPFELPIDDKYKNRIFGYIEFEDNSQWEEDLKINEDLEHYGPEKKNKKDFQDMRKEIISKLEIFAEEKNLIKRKQRDNNDPYGLNQVAEDFTDFLQNEKFNFDWSADIRKKSKSPLDITIKKYYPNSPKKYIYDNQKMDFNFKIKNYSNCNNFIYKITIESKNGIKEYEENNIEFGKEYVSNTFSILFTDFFDNQRNTVKLSVKAVDNPNVCEVATFPVFINCEESEEINEFELEIDYDLPNDNSLSIYQNQAINNITINIINNSEYDGKFKLRLLTQDVEDRNNTIAVEYDSEDLYIPSGESHNIYIGSILFGEKYISRQGPIKVKFILVHKSGIGDKEPGAKLVQQFFTILFNTEQTSNSNKLPFNINYENIEDIYKKYELRNTSKGKVLVFNKQYPTFNSMVENCIDQRIQKIYSVEIIFRCILSLQFNNSNYSALNITSEQASELSGYELDDRIEKVVSEYLGKYFEVR